MSFSWAIKHKLNYLISTEQRAVKRTKEQKFPNYIIQSRNFVINEPKLAQSAYNTADILD